MRALTLLRGLKSRYAHIQGVFRVAITVCGNGRDLYIRIIDLGSLAGPFGPWLGFSFSQPESHMFQDRFDAFLVSITLITRVGPWHVGQARGSHFLDLLNQLGPVPPA